MGDSEKNNSLKQPEGKKSNEGTAYGERRTKTLRDLSAMFQNEVENFVT